MKSAYKSYQECAISIALTYKNAAENTSGRENYLIARLVRETMDLQSFERRNQLSTMAQDGETGFVGAVSSFLYDLSFTANLIFQANIQEDSLIKQTAIEIEKIKNFASRQANSVFSNGLPQDEVSGKVTPLRIEKLSEKIPAVVEKRIFA
ncbi:MAG: hypothetical protein CL565_04075 [Alphaproteobacteria bacterium]|nr:hypothetical protein [Alphaproteobacteria bacterium]|tara:strand:+ start:723 stop:1175 length:453 start_codon:yes stop_codon:yes gene_type:complete